MRKSDAIKFLIIRTVGNFLLLFSLFGVGATFGPALYYEALFAISQARGVTYKVAAQATLETSAFGEILNQDKNPSTISTSGPGFSNVLAGAKEQILIPKDTEFNILIPKLGANEKIFPNVNAAEDVEYLPILRKGVAHARGSFFPGNLGNIYLFAHSTDNFWDVGRYNAVFYLIKNLTPGDEIVIFYQGVRHNYVVKQSRVVDASDVSYIVNGQKDKEVLILQTCWPPGTSWKRLLVFAEPK
ncbi:MAG: sortase [Candidatus Levybacteria bacterium]|nr:sortase [Candidatus Levybacteria bacterium]